MKSCGALPDYEDGQALFRTGQGTAGFYEVVTGNVRLVPVDRAGREAVLHVALAGEALALADTATAGEIERLNGKISLAKPSV